MENVKAKFGYGLGVFAVLPMSEQFSVQPEFYYNNKGAEYSENYVINDANYTETINFTLTYSMNYLEIPVLGVFNLTPEFSAFAGPYFDIFLNGKADIKSEYNIEYSDGTSDSDTYSESDDLKSDNMTIPGYGLVFGGEYSFGQLAVGVRYSMGLNNIPDDDVKMKHANAQVTFGYKIK